MRSTEDVLSWIEGFVREVLERPDVKLKSDSVAADVAGWDSAHLIELIMAAEATFAITFTSRETDTLTTFGDFAALIVRKTNL